MIDGVQVGSTVEMMDVNGYVTFDLSSAPKSLTAATHTFKVLVNIVGGSSRTTSLSLQRSADATFMDSELNVPILIQTNSSTFAAVTSGTQTISNGTLTITKKTTSASGKIVKGDSAVTLATYEFVAAGEPIKVETLRANAIVSKAAIDKLRNGKIYANGVQVGSTADLYAADGSSNYTEYSMGSSLIVTPGSPVTVDIKADVYDSDGTDSISSGDTIQAQIVSSTSNAQRTVALTYISSPSSDTPGNVLTVNTGTLACSKNTSFTDRTIITPQTSATQLAEFVCTAGSTEDVNLNTISVNVNDSTGNIDAAASSRNDIYDVYITYGDSTGTQKGTIASTTNDWNVNKTIAKNGNLTIKVFGKLKSTIGTGATINVDLDNTTGGTTANTNTAVTITTDANGQTITTGSGSLTTSVKSTPIDQIITGNQTVTAANYEISAVNDSYTVNEIAIKFNDTNVLDAVGGVYLYDGATPLRTNGDGTPYLQAIDANGYATTTGLSLAVLPGTSNAKTITVKLAINSVSSNGAAIGRNASTTLDSVRAQSSGGTDTYSSTDRQGNRLIVYKTLPIVTSETVATTAITNGASQEVYKFSVEPTGGEIGLKQFTLNLTWNDEGATVANNLELYNVILYEGTTDISADVTTVTDDALSVEADTAGLGATSSVSSSIVFAFATEKQLTSKTTFTVKAKPRNFEKTATSSDYVILTMAADTTDATGSRFVGDADGDNIWGLGTSATGTNTEYNFLWTDRSRDSHANTSGSSTADFANGYLVKNLPLSSVTMSK